MKISITNITCLLSRNMGKRFPCRLPAAAASGGGETTKFQKKRSEDEKVFAFPRCGGAGSRPPDGFSQPSEVDGARQEPGAGVPPGCVLLPPDFLSHPAGHVHVPDGGHDGGRWLHSARGEFQITAIRCSPTHPPTPRLTRCQIALWKGFFYPADNTRNLVAPSRRPY